MLNIPELERRWFQYKIKSYIPYLSILISLIVICALSLFFYSYEKTTPTPKEEKTVTHLIKQKPIKQKIKTVIKEQVIQPTLVEATLKNTQNKKAIDNKQELTPSLDFIKRMQNSVQPYYNSEETQSVVSKQKKEQAQIEPAKEEAIQKVPTKIIIRREDTKNDIRDIIKRFRDNNNPALSLFVAKKSYELGDYKQAYNYALITNRVNSNIEASWIVFAKSLVKLGKKKKAIQTLQKYIAYSNSGDAKVLLDNITSGKFR